MGLSRQSCRSYGLPFRELYSPPGLHLARYPTRNEVDSANSTRLSKLPGAPRDYVAVDSPGRDWNGKLFSRERVEHALKVQIVPKLLPLKVGAVVMLVKVRT